jgi:hypothetical protein
MTPDREALRAAALARKAACERDAKRDARVNGDYAAALEDQLDFATLSIPLRPLLALLDEHDALVGALEEMIGMAELFVPAPLDAPGFKRARSLLSTNRQEAKG